MIGMRKILALLLTTTLMCTSSTAGATMIDDEEEEFIEGVVEEVPETIYRWVQSTARANYYFNFRRMSYGVTDEGFIDLDVLLVPALFIYDDVQKDDVISKRRWRGQSREGYDQLVGRADYLEFRLSEGTVQVTERNDLDDQWGVLDSDRSGEPIELAEMSHGGVEYKFYRAILYYAKRHNAEIIANTSGRLSPEDHRLADDEMPIIQMEVP